MQPLKAIIFDLGGVILNIDYNKTSAAFKAAGVKNIDEMYSQKVANQLFEDLETGKVTQTQFYDEIRNSGMVELTNQQIKKAWDAMLLDFREETLLFIASLKSKYKIFLLSNTNSIHLSRFYEIYDSMKRQSTFESLFDEIYYSHLIGARKPDLAAYQYVIDRNNLNAGECLFIDDSIQNIEGARLAGLNAIQLTSEMKVEELDFDYLQEARKN